MTIPRQVWATLMFTGGITMAGALRGGAQINKTLTEQDRAEIQALSVTYRRALFGCEADVYADLFATPGGYFGSSARGEVRERLALMEMVLSYDRCHTTPRPAAPEARTTTPTLPPRSSSRLRKARRRGSSTVAAAATTTMST